AVKEGQMVSKNQFLLQIDPENAKAAVQRSEAVLASSRAQQAQTKANLQQAQSSYQRSLTIKKSNPQLVADEQLEQLKTQVVVQIDAFPDTNFVGKVTKLSNSSVKGAVQTTADQAVDYEVTIQLLNAPRETRPDFSATAKIVTDKRKNVIAIPIIALTVRESQ